MILNHPIMFSISSEIFNVFGNIQQMFCRSDGPQIMFCHRGQSSSDKIHFYEVEAAGSDPVQRPVAVGRSDLFNSKEERQMLSPWAAGPDWVLVVLVVPRVGATLGALVRWNGGYWAGTGLDWALNTILNIFSEAPSQYSPARPLLIFHFQHWIAAQ